MFMLCFPFSSLIIAVFHLGLFQHNLCVRCAFLHIYFSLLRCVFTRACMYAVHLHAFFTCLPAYVVRSINFVK